MTNRNTKSRPQATGISDKNQKIIDTVSPAYLLIFCWSAFKNTEEKIRTMDSQQNMMFLTKVPNKLKRAEPCKGKGVANL